MPPVRSFPNRGWVWSCSWLTELAAADQFLLEVEMKSPLNSPVTGCALAVSQIDTGSVRPQQAVSQDGYGVNQSQPEQGRSMLPVQAASAKHTRAVTEGGRVLVAEDDSEMRALLVWQLSKAGFEVTECDHGIDLINRIDPIGSLVESEKVDLIISDIRMPGITGLEVLEDVRHCGTECPPVILITAFGDRDTHMRACELGVAAVFDKPFEFGDLLAKARELAPPQQPVEE